MTEPSASRRVLITGTSSGFGLGGAKALAQRGHTVLATMRGVDGKNRQAADELRALADRGGHALHVIELDVTNDASVRSAVGQALELAGGIDTVINNAGVGTIGIQEAFSPEQYLRLLDVNVVGSFRVNRAVLPRMRAAGAGHIVFVSSGVGRLVFPFLGPYASTKFAVEAIAENLAMEVGPLGVGVTIIQPGIYGTSFAANSQLPANGALIEDYGPVAEGFSAFMQRFQQLAESGQMGDPQEVVDAFVRVVEAPAGQRPLRVVLGKDVEQGVDAINGACAQVQGAVMAAMGMAEPS